MKLMECNHGHLILKTGQIRGEGKNEERVEKGKNLLICHRAKDILHRENIILHQVSYQVNSSMEEKEEECGLSIQRVH